MLVVRLFGRAPVLTTAIKRTSSLQLLAGITSGGSALVLGWKHYRVHAASPPKFDSTKIQSIVRDVKGKAISSEKFDWNLFWYYLRPQIWIIACATAVNLYFSSLLHEIKHSILDRSGSGLSKCSYST